MVEDGIYTENFLLSDDSSSHKIFKAIAEVFQTGQTTYAGHRRHVAVLNKIYDKCITQGLCEIFHYWFNRMTMKVLPLKRQEVAGDRIIRLIANFIASNELVLEKQKNKDEDNKNREYVFNLFLNQFLRHILRGIESKDKNVRYRVTQLLAVIMDNMGEMDEELYNLILWSLQKRVYDKESSVRVQAIFCLTKLQDDVMNEEKDFDDATKNLILSIQNDPSAEVRRAAMLNLSVNEFTIEYILERARDINSVNRRLIYSRILKSFGKKVFEQLNYEMIDKLLIWGLEDREDSVRQACNRLISFDWLNMMNGDIIGLLENLNVLKSQSSDKVLNSIFQHRSDIIDKLKFSKEIWNNFTIETVYLLRCFYIYCHEISLNELIDENFPEALGLAEIIRVYIARSFESTEISERDKESLDFIIEQLLFMSFRYDFSDEVGRRDMLNVVRSLLIRYPLTESLINIGLKVLKILSINERDFITMTVEIIMDIRDEDIEKQEQGDILKEQKQGNDKSNNNLNPIESFHSSVENIESGNDNFSLVTFRDSSEEQQPSSETLVICLQLSRYMLELVTKLSHQNIMINSLIDILITPAVRNSQSKIRDLALRCLGLCCLLDVQLAIESMYILGMCVSKGNASLKKIALQVIVDIFSVYGTKVVDGEGKVDSISLHKIFYKILKNTDLPDCQAIAAEGLCKLFLADVFIDDDLFETLVLSYFSPVNAKNEALIQAFAFGLPVYCFSHINHQERMSRVASDILLRLSILWNDLQSADDNEERDLNSMLKPSVIFQQLIYWTDPSKVIGFTQEEYLRSEVQINFLLEVLKIYHHFERKDIKRMFLTNLSKFKITTFHSLQKLKLISELVNDILENEEIDKGSANALTGFIKSLNYIIDEIVDHDDTNKNRDDSDNEHSERLIHSENFKDNEISENDEQSNSSFECDNDYDLNKNKETSLESLNNSLSFHGPVSSCHINESEKQQNCKRKISEL